jgi:hypothetical protein
VQFEHKLPPKPQGSATPSRSVLSSLQNAVLLQSDRPRPRRISLLTLLLFAFCSIATQSIAQEAGSLDDAIRQLTERIGSIPNLRGPLRVQFFQDAALGAAMGNEWQNNLRREFEKHQIATTDDSTARPLRVGLAETPTQIILSAGVRVGDKDEVRVIAFPRVAVRPVNSLFAPVRIEKQLVVQTPERVLDAASVQNGSETAILLLTYHNAELAILQFGATGGLQDTFSLAVAGAQPSRDPHGELTVHERDISIQLSGKSCLLNLAAPSDAKCRTVKPSWRTHVTLTPSCDSGGWKLLAEGADWNTPDLLQAVPVGEIRKVSSPNLSDFPGPILSINADQNPAGALVVTRNLRSGIYEVYKITLACGN